MRGREPVAISTASAAMTSVPSAVVDLDVVRARAAAPCREQPHALALQQPRRALLQLVLDALDAVGRAPSMSTSASCCSRPMPLDAAG